MASTQQFSMNLGIPLIPEIQDQKQFAEFVRLYNSIRILAAALDSYTGALPQDSTIWSQLTPADTLKSQNTRRLYVPFSEGVAAGEAVTLYDNAGVLTAKKAGGSPWAGDCRGFCTKAVTLGAFGEVMLGGYNPFISGLTAGTLYYISNSTPGAITSTKPTVAGTHVQPVGFALGTTGLYMEPSLYTITN